MSAKDIGDADRVIRQVQCEVHDGVEKLGADKTKFLEGNWVIALAVKLKSTTGRGFAPSFGFGNLDGSTATAVSGVFGLNLSRTTENSVTQNVVISISAIPNNVCMNRPAGDLNTGAIVMRAAYAEQNYSRRPDNLVPVVSLPIEDPPISQTTKIASAEGINSGGATYKSKHFAVPAGFVSVSSGAEGEINMVFKRLGPPETVRAKPQKTAAGAPKPKPRSGMPPAEKPDTLGVPHPLTQDQINGAMKSLFDYQKIESEY
ncbi:hypothetical protein [Rhizobium sp. G21]|uniref:hypothetical protein n=1 Tax=Rhizobium sp. G21 TaxID=2758439 RepID=UPI001602F974|nr:hypothetical protein [Rhizobium sp. G21]MBB1248317.1 hypothetical protein [Rhizobium sp. G21]